MSFGTGLGFAISAIGGAMTVAPFVLPRSAFGELGHGDGMGLIGLSMMGVMLVFGGLVFAGIAAWLSSRNPPAEQNEARVPGDGSNTSSSGE